MFYKNMNKKYLIVIIVAVVVIVGIVAVVDWRNGNVAQAPVVPVLSVASGSVASASGTPVTVGSPSSSVSVGVSSTGGSGYSVSFQNFYQNGSFSFNYPESWSVSRIIPFSVNNFNDKFEVAGVIPKGGAEIIVATTTVRGNLADIMAAELVSAKNLATSTVAVSKIACSEARFNATYGPDAVAQNIFVYCPRGTELWKIYCAYPAGDPAATADVSACNEVLNSMKFLP
jgi:hypothetical protein